MPTIILRHTSNSDQLTLAVESLGYEFERKWSPGDRYLKTRICENFGFNLCLAWEKDDIPVAKCLKEALQEVDEMERELSAVGLSLRGCTVDIGVFGDPETFTRCVRLDADQCAYLGNLGVDFEVSFYPSSKPES